MPPVEVYWIPGCSSCLRMKEFVERTGVPYEEYNLVTHPDRRQRLAALGLMPPAVVVGERGVPGLDLVAIAELVGSSYVPPPILPPAALKDRYGVVMAALRRLIAQIPPAALDRQLPHRPRPARSLVAHAATTPMLAFLDAYDSGLYNGRLLPEPALAEHGTIAELGDAAAATVARLDAWWDRFGYDDDFTNVVETHNPHWGHRTLREVFERSVWHTTQHVRQLAYFLETLDIAPDRPLTDADLAGLPLPERLVA